MKGFRGDILGQPNVTQL